MKSQFELNGGTYIDIDGINYPNILPPEPDPRPIGIWGMRHEEYLKTHRDLTYMNLLTTGKLDSYLADVDEQARDMLDRLVLQMAEAEGITEQLKEQDQMEWVRRMNCVRHRAEEIVIRKFDSFIVSGGVYPRTAEALKYYGSAPEFYIAGDCAGDGEGSLQKALRSAYGIAMQV